MALDLQKVLTSNNPQKSKFSTLIEMVTLTFHSNFNSFSWNDFFFQKYVTINSYFNLNFRSSK